MSCLTTQEYAEIRHALGVRLRWYRARRFKASAAERIAALEAIIAKIERLERFDGAPAPAPRSTAAPAPPEPACPGPDCPMCNGEACARCNPGPGWPVCEHDGQERHEEPEPEICGACPRRGDGTLWCEKPAGHTGLHKGDGVAFSARAPGRRVTASGIVVNEPPRRRVGAVATPPIMLRPGANWRCDRRGCNALAVAVVKCHRKGCHADFARCAAHGGADGVARSWRAHASQMAHETSLLPPPPRRRDCPACDGGREPLANGCAVCDGAAKVPVAK